MMLRLIATVACMAAAAARDVYWYVSEGEISNNAALVALHGTR